MSVLDSIEYNIRSMKAIFSKKKYLQEQLTSIKEDLSEVSRKIELSKESKKYYIKGVDILYEESLGALKNTLNTALQHIMYDKNYTVDLIVDDKRSTKTLEIVLIDNDTGLEVALKDGVGQGVRTIISFVLKVYYLLNKGSKILLLDEKYSAISAAYVNLFFEFVTKLAHEKGMVIVLITHDERFKDYGEVVYYVNDGFVQEVVADE